MAFRGHSDTTLDAKNRLTIPAKRRQPFASGAVVALQRDAPRCLAIWCTADFNAYVDSAMEGMHPLSDDYVKIERYYYSFSEELELDAAGRVMLPATLLEVAGLGREVTLIGVGKHLEVWDREAWGHARGDMLNTARDIRPGTANGHTA